MTGLNAKAQDAAEPVTALAWEYAFPEASRTLIWSAAMVWLVAEKSFVLSACQLVPPSKLYGLAWSEAVSEAPLTANRTVSQAGDEAVTETTEGGV
jgi:hypothetical protein